MLQSSDDVYPCSRRPAAQLFGCADILAALCTLPRRRTLGLRTGGFSYVMFFGLISALLLNKEVHLNCSY